MQNTGSPPGAHLDRFDIYASYRRSRYLSLKHASYFQVYEELLSRYRNRKCTFVEVGVSNGGSLFMWRDYLGPEARVIGIDLNPLAGKWSEEGFEIHIGNQADPRFWENFFAVVGDVDVVLDDGGHTNEQQIVTAHACIPHIRDGGMLIVEDTHASYLKLFGNPSRYSFMNYAKRTMDRINARFPGLHASGDAWEKCVYSMCVYESIVCFNVDRERCFVNSPTSNDGITSDARDFRHEGAGAGGVVRLRNVLRRRFGFLARIPGLRAAGRYFFESVLRLHARLRQRGLKKYF